MVTDDRINLFSNFTLDLARGCLLDGARPIHLRRQAYEVLRYLVENRGHLISKDQLIAEIWQGRAVTDGSLGKCIEEVREALGPEAREYLRNVRGRGYIFEPGTFGTNETVATRHEQIEFVRLVVEDEGSAVRANAINQPASGSSGLRTLDLPLTHVASSAIPEVNGVKHRRVLWLVAGILIAASAAGTFSYLNYFRSSSKPITSIAVLPLVNESADQNMDYLSDGLSESLINSLSQLPQLKVIAKSSSFKYRGVTVDPPKVAAALGVEAILSGRVSQRGDNLLINVELVDARDNTHVWGEQYNRKATDLLQVQSEISREIATKLRLRLTGGEQQQLVKRQTVNPQAYEMLLKGRFYRSKGGMENLKKAKEYFEQAIAVDPTYAHAYSELSEICAFLVTLSVLDPKDFMPKAEVAARKAMELDDSLAEAHLAMGGLRVLTWDWVSAERELKRAIELNPNLAQAHRRYAFYLNIRRRHDEALAEGHRARELDPLTPNFSWLTLQRRYDQALEGLKKALEMGQGNAFVYLQLGVSYAGKGQYPEAIAAYREAIRLGDDSPDTQILLGCAYAKAGERDQAQAILKRLNARREYVSPGALAVLYVALGDPERALELLERAYVEHDNQLHNLAVHPHLDPLRSDPRFQDLVRRVGLPS